MEANCNTAATPLLIIHGADAMSTHSNGITTLHHAVSSPSCIAVALENGGDSNTTNGCVETPIQFANALDGRNAKFVELLEQHSKEQHNVSDDEAANLSEDYSLVQTEGDSFRESASLLSS